MGYVVDIKVEGVADIGGWFNIRDPVEAIQNNLKKEPGMISIGLAFMFKAL